MWNRIAMGLGDGASDKDGLQSLRPSALSGEGRNRTGDPTVFSRVLYQLSYLAEAASV